MEKNVGAADGYIRVIFGVAFLMIIFDLNTGAIGTILLLVLALMSFITAYTGYCHLYKVLNISTCPKNPTVSDDEPQASVTQAEE